MRTAITTETRQDLLAMGFNRQAVWKIIKQGWYTKPKRKENLPIWQYLEPSWIYDTVRKITWINTRNRNEGLNLQEDLLDYVYKIDFEGIEFPKAYCNSLLRSRARNYRKLYSVKFEKIQIGMEEMQ